MRSFDERNELLETGYSRSMPVEKFFEMLDATKEEREKRENTAHGLEEAMMFVFSLLLAFKDSGRNITVYELYKQFEESYTNELINLGIDITPRIREHIEDISYDLADNTWKHVFEGNNDIEDLWYLSNDRATLIGENEAQTVHETIRYENALEEGKTMKRWKSMLLRTTRETHRELNNMEIPIEQPFKARESLLMFPRDTSLNALASEIVNCVCTVEYF